METNYQRCPEDTATLITSMMSIPGVMAPIELSLAVTTTVLSMSGNIYTTTMAIKNGVGEDFTTRVAAALSDRMGGDTHALCPVIAILCETFAVMTGGKVVLDKNGLVNIFPSKECPGWMRGYFNRQMEDEA